MQSNDKVSVSIILVYIFVLKTRDVKRFGNFFGKRERGREGRKRERERNNVFLCLRNESSRGEI